MAPVSIFPTAHGIPARTGPSRSPRNSCHEGIRPDLHGLASAALVALGCETLNLRKNHRDDDPDVKKASADEVESTKVLDVQSDSAKPKPFFRPSRLSGGLSDEAREIESHVGIH